MQIPSSLAKDQSQVTKRIRETTQTSCSAAYGFYFLWFSFLLSIPAATSDSATWVRKWACQHHRYDRELNPLFSLLNKDSIFIMLTSLFSYPFVTWSVVHPVPCHDNFLKVSVPTYGRLMALCVYAIHLINIPLITTYNWKAVFKHYECGGFIRTLF